MSIYRFHIVIHTIFICLINKKQDIYISKDQNFIILVIIINRHM